MREEELRVYRNKAIEKDRRSIENRLNHAFNQGYEMGRQMAKSDWVPVSERLPDIDEAVLVDDGLDIFVAWWVDDGLEARWHSLDESCNPDRPILAWMPLPKPYKAESEVQEC